MKLLFLILTILISAVLIAATISFTAIPPPTVIPRETPQFVPRHVNVYDLDKYLERYQDVAIQVGGVYYTLHRKEEALTVLIRNCDGELVGFFEGKPESKIYKRWKLP